MSKSNNVPTAVVAPLDVEMTESNSNSLAISKAEIDLQISTAKQYPRDLAQFQKSGLAMVTYSREAAEKMYYKLPRKDRKGNVKIIEGPSVRLAEIIAQNWRNCRVAARIIGNDNKFVTSQGIFHDLETNVAISFDIRRRITRKDGTRYDEDMISVTGAAAAAVAFRNAVLKGIPRLFWAPLYEKALETSRLPADELANRRKMALEEFSKMDIPEAAILKTLGVTGITKIDVDKMVILRGIYTAIQEGITSAKEAFGLEERTIKPTEEVVANGGVPKAQIPKPPISDDPLIDAKEQTKIFDKALSMGWKIDEVRHMLKKKFKLESVKGIHRSQLQEIYSILDSGV
jgi:hypothetical protein